MPLQPPITYNNNPATQNNPKDRAWKWLPWNSQPPVDVKIEQVQKALEKHYPLPDNTQHPEITKDRFNEYMHYRFLQAVNDYEKLEDQNTFFYSGLQVVLIFFSALSTFIVGLGAIFVSVNALKIAALVATLVVAALGNYLVTFNFQMKGGKFRNARDLFITEFYRFHMQVKPYTNADRSICENLFVSNVEQHIKDINTGMEGLNSRKQL